MRISQTTSAKQLTNMPSRQRVGARVEFTNFVHNEVIWMFEAVLFKLVDTL